MNLPAPLHIQSALAALLGGLVLLYASALSLAGSMVGVDEVTAGRRAISHAIPIAITAIIAALMGHLAMALGILTATAVAAVSLAPGIALVISSTQPITPQWARRWRTLLPAALVLWLIGFSSEIDLIQACFLVIEGLALVLIWREPSEATAAPPAQQPITVGRFILILLGIGLAIVGAPLAISGSAQQQFNLPLTLGIVAAGILAPILILPILSESARLAERGRGAEARTAQVGLALINICLLIPVIVFIGYGYPHHSITAATAPSTQPAVVNFATPFPIGIWRVDSVLLVVLGLWLLASTLGRWTSTKIEGVILIILYAAYLVSIAQFHAF